MAMAKMKYLSEGEVKSVADPILRKHLDDHGLAGSAIEEVEDFDGASIFRLVASVDRPVPAKILIETNEAMHSALPQKGEDRFVILSTERPETDANLPDEDIG